MKTQTALQHKFFWSMKLIIPNWNRKNVLKILKPLMMFTDTLPSRQLVHLTLQFLDQQNYKRKKFKQCKHQKITLQSTNYAVARTGYFKVIVNNCGVSHGKSYHWKHQLYMLNQCETIISGPWWRYTNEWITILYTTPQFLTQILSSL